MRGFLVLIVILQCGAYLLQPAFTVRYKSSSPGCAQLSQVFKFPLKVSNHRSNGIIYCQLSPEVDLLADCEARLVRCEEEKSLLKNIHEANPEDKTSMILEAITTAIAKEKGDNERKTAEAIAKAIAEAIAKERTENENKTAETIAKAIAKERKDIDVTLQPLVFNHATALALQVLCIYSGGQPKESSSIAKNIFVDWMYDTECRNMLELKAGRHCFDGQWKACQLFDELRDARNLQAHPSNRKDFDIQISMVLKSLETYLPLDDLKIQEVYWILKNKDKILSYPHRNRKQGWKDGWIAEAAANSNSS